ncbi:adenylate/guanylate cyclase domain-containing protein [Pyruvatibacter sp.]|uniref:CHASE2 domain-containing protein n=1 Tax=Pyruvatibacter sp. TaxID=1981328 RepID=UPI0032EC5664
MKTIQLLRRLAAALASLALAGWLVLMQYDPASLATSTRMAVFDTYQSLSPRPYRDPAVTTGTGVVYVDVDRASLERLGPWPWPRTRFATLIDEILDRGARAIVFEMPFEWPDATSPGEAVQEWLVNPDLDIEQILRLQEAATDLPDHDAVLAAAIARGPVVTSFSLTDRQNALIPVAKAPVTSRGGPLADYIPARAGMSPSLKSLEDAAAGNGADTLSSGPGNDDIIRQVPLLERVSTTIVPGLALEAVRVAENARGVLAFVAQPDAELSFGRRPGLQRIVVGSKEFPTDADGGLWLHYTDAAPNRSLPAWKVLGRHPDAARLSNAIVFVTATVRGSEAFVTSPLGDIPRVEAHAQAMEQMLLGHYLWRPDWAQPAEQVYLLITGVIVLMLLIVFGTVWAALFGIVAIAGAIWGGWFAFTSQLWLVDPALPVIGLLLAFLIGSTMNLMRRNMTDKFIRAQFADRLPPKQVSALARNPSAAAPAGRTSVVTALSSDVRAFHRVAETFGGDAASLAKLVNHIHEPMSKCVLRHDGMVDRFVGGGMNALWNAPVERDDHTVQACQAALRMVAEIEPVNRSLEREARRAHRPFIPVSMSIGIERGDAVVGNLGAEHVYDFSAIGGAVNEAQVLQRLSRRYGPAIIVGAVARDEVKGRFALLEIDQLRLDGRLDPWRVYALLGDPIMRANPKFKALEEAHAALFKSYAARDWPAARAVIAQCRQLSGAIPTLYDLYEERIARHQITPPADDWKGVHEIADLLSPAKSRVAIGKPEPAELGDAPV